MTFIDNSNEWKLPFNIALGVHFLFVLSVIYMPQFLHKKPLYPDIYTIDLISVQTPQAAVEQKTPPPPQLPKPEKTTEAVVKKIEAAALKKPVSVTPPVEIKPVSVTPPVEIKPVSIKPLKRKIIKEETVDPTIEQKKKLEELNKKYIKEAREAERLAAEAAKIAALEAVNQLKQMIRESRLSEAPKDSVPTQSSGTTPRVSRSVLESQYFASLQIQLQNHWTLPEYKQWDPDLFAIIVIQIEKNGTITNQFFEQKSGDRLFDQFVLKTLQESSPLPEIPAAMQKERLEIGIRFRPGLIQF